ncbi:MAG: hypothetical protein HY512_00275 [Candidatus Aenigmarchaeota archaeon]|nr:hypothetical protein [Candidatus Aenigmarchaeota archaeon]
MKIVSLVSDIMFIPVIQSALSKHDVQFIESYNGEDAELFVLDMDHKDSYEVCKRFPKKSICFGSHKSTEQIKKFTETGCKDMIARSLLNKRLREVI